MTVTATEGGWWGYKWRSTDRGGIVSLIEHMYPEDLSPIYFFIYSPSG